VKKESGLAVNLAAIPRNDLAPEKPSHEAVDFLSHVPQYEVPKAAPPRSARRTPTTRALKQNRSTRYQYRAYHKPLYRPVHRRHFNWLHVYPTPRPFDGFLLQLWQDGSSTGGLPRQHPW
jgi:hypothetical protein